jgi:NitT/TauT family transport system permease protein
VTSRSRLERLKAPAWSLLGLVLLVGVWELCSRHYSGLAVASPWDTLAALARLLTQRDFLREHLLASLIRAAMGLGLGFTVGLSLGALAGALPPLRQVLTPPRWMLMSVPGVVVVMLAMLWFGMGGVMVVAIVAGMSAPVVYVSVVEGLDAVDRRHLEMAKVYRFPTAMRLYRIYVMAMAGPLLSGGLVALGGAIRMVVLAEALGAGQGLGYSLALARTNLQTPQLYALALLCICIVAGTELAVLRPVRRRVLRRGIKLKEAGLEEEPQAASMATCPFQPPPLVSPPGNQVEPVLRLQGVGKYFQGREVLRGVNLEVGTDEIIGVLGPSGVGKSTLLRLVAGLERPDHGSLQMKARRLGYVFQEPRLLPWCTAQENVALSLMAQGLKKGRARALARAYLAAMGLRGRENAYPSELSGGMRQRVSLARALALSPDLLLLDEPFTGLDPDLRRNMLKFLQASLAHHHTAVIQVTHDRAELPAATRRVIYLDGQRGLVCLQGPSEKHGPARC